MTGEQPHVVEISGETGLRNSRDIAALLTTALANHNNVAVDASKAASIDVTILQLLVAARKSALAAGKSLRLHAPAEGVLRQALTKTGFVSADGRPLTPEGTFWTDTRQS
jgi:anti-anti-sigma regulatory factor